MGKRFWNPANSVSIFRLPFLFLIITIIMLPSFANELWQLLALCFLALLFLLDQIDGFLARKTGSVTKIGGMVDVMVDRIVELILWVAFAFMTLVPLWVPFLFITRGIITDTIRGEAYRKDLTPYEMIQSKPGKIVVSSHISRGIYAILKGFTFCYLLATRIYPALFPGKWGTILVYATAAYCVARGVPVIYDARELFEGTEH